MLQVPASLSRSRQDWPNETGRDQLRLVPL